MDHPLLVFDGETAQLVTALLRPGRVHAARGAAPILERLIRAIKHRCPHAAVVVRGDSAFALPRSLARLEALAAELGDVHDVVGPAKSSQLLALAAPRCAEAAAEYAATQRFVRRFAWPQPTSVVLEVEHGERGDNLRFPRHDADRAPTRLRPRSRGLSARAESESFIEI